MAIRAEDFLSSATELASASSEISQRNSISRTYYFAFHSVMGLSALLPGDNLRPDGYGMHEHLIWRLKKAKQIDATFAPALLATSVGYVLSHMRAVRTLADYNLSHNFSANEARHQLEFAEKLAQKTAELSNAISKK